MRRPTTLYLAVLLFSTPLAAQTLFGPPALKPTAAPLVAGVVADVNGDGVVDLVAREVGVPGPQQTLVRLGSGGGDFAEPTLLPWAGFGALAPAPLALGDLNGDGAVDLVVDALEDDSLLLFKGDGRGGFDGSSSPSYITPGSGEKRAVLLDLDDDGSRELIMWSTGLNGSDPTVGGLLAWSFDADFQPQYLFGFSGLPADSLTGNLLGVARGDVDGDGVADMLFADTAFDRTSTRVLVMQGIGGLGFKPAVEVDVLPGLSDIRAFDFDHDGRLDLLGRLASGAPGVQLFSGDAAGGFTPGPITPLPEGVVALHAADFDGDGVGDLIAALDAAVQPSPAPSALVLRGVDDGTFGDALPLSPLPGADFPLSPGAFHPALLLVGDVDPDGRPDVLLAYRLPLATGPAIAVLRNETYAGEGPLLDLGGALPGSLGAPIQLASGSFSAGTLFAFDLAQAKPGGNAFLVAGFSELGAAFKGGVMVPSVDRVFGPLPVLAGGEAGVAGFWPAGVPTGSELYAQFWIPDEAGVAGFASSSAVRVQTP